MVEKFASSETVLCTRSLIIGYRRETAVCAIPDMDIGRGELVLLKGPNGSGKTTFLKTAAGLLKPLKGSIDAAPAALIPARIPKVKGFTVKEFICTWLGFSPRSSQAPEVAEVLQSVGLFSLLDNDISSLSDGQFQKVCLCPAIVSGKRLLLLDEPTAFLDADSRLQLMDVLKSLSRNSVTVVFSSHDLAVCTPYCDRIIDFAASEGVL